MSNRDISINTRPVASQYDGPAGKTIEFSSPAGGGLISFTLRDDRLDVHVYRHDMTVAVSAGDSDEPVRSGNLRMDRALYEAAKAYVTAWEARAAAAAQAELISAARSWAADCEWLDGEDIADMSDAQIVAGVEAHYDGGWAAFADAGTA
jgi:hypothetical protein